MRSFWDFYAWIYDILNSFSPYRRLQRKVIAALQLIPYLAIADCGCGTGNTIIRISEEGKWNTQITGFEKSPAMSARAEKKLRGKKGIKIIHGDFENLSVFGKKKYDRVISVNSLYVAKDPGSVLKNWFDILDDGGLVVIANPCVPKMFFFREFFNDVMRGDMKTLFSFLLRLPLWIVLISINWNIARKAKGRHFHFLSSVELRAFAETAGFGIVSEELVYGGGSILMVLQKDSGSSIRRAHTHEEIGECYRIRYNAYCEGIKSLPSENYPDKKESDAFDAYAAHFIWKEGGFIVGCIRLIPDYGVGFLLEDGGKFPIPISFEGGRNSILEFSRMAVTPSRRGKNIGYAAAEYAARWGFERAYCTKWIAMCQERVWNGFIRNGWIVSLWGEYREYHDTLSSPGMLIPPFLNKNSAQ